MKKQLITLLGGTALAQLIPILISPILTRLYSPDQFGIFALFSSIVLTAIIVTTLRMEMAIILPKKHYEANNIVKIILYSSIIVISLFTLIYISFEKQLATFEAIVSLYEYLYFIPIAIFLFGMSQAYYYLANRYGFFKAMSIFKVIRSSSTASLQVLFGILNLGTFGLIIGFVISLFLSLLYFIKVLRVKYNNFYNNFTLAQSKNHIKRYKDFPLILMPSSLFEAMSVHMPIFLLASLYNPYIAGLYALTQRIIQLPISVISTSVSDVLRKKVANEYQSTGNSRSTIILTIKRLSIVALLFTSLLYSSSEIIFSIVFGEEWALAGKYVEIMSLMIFMRIVANPLGIMFVIAEKQIIDLYIQIVTFILAFIGLYLGYYFYNSPEKSILFFSMAYSLKFLLEGSFAFYFSKKKVFNEI